MDKSRHNSSVSSRPAEKPSTGFLSLRHVIGFRANAPARERMFDLSSPESPGKRLLYCAGNIVVIAQLETKAQTFITPLEDCLAISAIAVSKDRSLIAVAEQTEVTGVISVHEFRNEQLRKRKTLLARDAQACAYSHLLFSGDGESRLLVSLTEPPALKVLVWEWAKGKVRAVLDVAGFSQVSGLFIPDNDPSLLFLYGLPSAGLPVKCLWLRRDNDQLALSTKNDIIKDFLKTFGKHFLAHCALPDNTIIFGNERGELILFSRQFELKQVLGCSPLNNIRINALRRTARGFAAGGSGVSLLFFERRDNDPKAGWELSPQSLVGQGGELDSVLDVVLFDGETAVIGLDSGELVGVGLAAGGPPRLEPALAPFHAGQLVDIDVCERKPLVATAGLDNTVRVWNFQDFALECEKTFDQEILGLSFHFTGLYLAVALRDRIKVLAFQHAGLAPLFEILVNEARLIRFSSGGHLLAVACENSINIFDFFSGEFRNNVFLKAGEPLTINCLRWAEDDLRIFASCQEGQVFEVEVRENMRYNLLFKSEQSTLGFSVWNEYRTRGPLCLVAAVLADRSVRVESLARESEARDLKPLGELPGGPSGRPPGARPPAHPSNPPSQTGSFFSRTEGQPRTVLLQGQEPLSGAAIANSGKYLVLATDGPRGVLRVFQLPELGLLCEFNLSGRGIKKLVLAPDDSMLFAITRDNCAFFLELRDRELKERREKEGSAFALEEFLIDEKILKRQVEETEELQAQVLENEKLAELSMKRTRLRKEEHAKGFEARMRSLVEDRVRQVRQIEEELDELGRGHQAETEALAQAFAERRRALEQQHGQRLEREAGRLTGVVEAHERLAAENAGRLEQFTAEHKARTGQLTAGFEERLGAIDAEVEAVERRTRETIAGFRRQADEVEGELDAHIDARKAAHEQELERLIRARNKREYELSLAKVEFNNMVQQKNQAEKEHKDNSEQIKTLESKIKELRKEREANDRELAEREKTIGQKQERISELVNKKHELDKFKFVLHYKIEELRKEKGPRELEIAKMKQQLETMQQEIYLFAKTNAQLKLAVAKWNLKLQAQTASLRDLDLAVAERAAALAAFKRDLSALLLARLEDFKALKKGLVALHGTFVEEDRAREAEGERKKTFAEQRGHLENCLKTLKEKFGRSISLHKNDHKRVMKENVDLISAINELKRERKLKVDNISKVEALKHDAQREIELALRIAKNGELIAELQAKIEMIKKTEPVQLIN